MASLINHAFQSAKRENRPALLTYTVAGDNTKKNSLKILKAISKYADICEVGFPQSTDSNPGEEDSASVTAIEKSYFNVIGVAGPKDVVSGGYTLTITVEDY